MNKPSKNNFAVVCFPYCSTRLGCFIILPQAANVRHDMCMHDCYYSKSYLGCVDATVWRNKRIILFCFIIILFGECSVGMGHPIFGFDFSTPFPNYSATRVVARTFHPMFLVSFFWVKCGCVGPNPAQNRLSQDLPRSMT